MAYNNYQNNRNEKGLISRNNQPMQSGAQAPSTSLANMIKSPAIEKRFSAVLGKSAPSFLAGVLGAVNVNPMLAKADPTSVLASAMVAATLNLSCVPSLGQAALVPYKDNKTGVVTCQFQIMTRGIVQTAQRSGQYRTINTGCVYSDEYDGEDLLTGEVKFHRVTGGHRDNGCIKEIVGYFAYIETITGFKHTEYWTKEDIINHAQRYSKSYTKGPWKDNFDAMAQKTVLKSCINHYGPMSVDSVIADAIAKDQLVFDTNGKGSYEDNPISLTSAEDDGVTGIPADAEPHVEDAQFSAPEDEAPADPEISEDLWEDL